MGEPDGSTEEVIEHQPARLVEVAGLGPKRTAMITAAFDPGGFFRFHQSLP
jgi:hypothetical protein